MSDVKTQEDLRKEHALLSQRAQESKLEADGIRARLQESQSALNKAESIVEETQSQIRQLEQRQREIEDQLKSAKKTLQSAEEQRQVVLRETAEFAERLGPIAQKQRRFADALSMLEQSMGNAVPPRPPVQQPSHAGGARGIEQPTRSKRTSLEVNLSFQLDVGMESDHNFYTGLTNNISEGGLFIATQQLLDIGTKISFPLALPGMLETEKVDGIVRWVRREDLPEQNIPCGIGVQFTRISEKLQTRINHYIQQRESIFYDD